MSSRSFLNIRSSHPEGSCKKCVRKINILQNSLKNTNDAVFQVNESRYIEFFVVSRSIKKLISIDCVNIYFLNQ